MNLLLISALSWVFLHTAVSGSEHCCLKKNVGGVMYNLVKEQDTSAYDCLANCVYEKDGGDGKRFCFAAGYEESVCVLSSTTGSTQSMTTTPTTIAPDINQLSEKITHLTLLMDKLTEGQRTTTTTTTSDPMIEGVIIAGGTGETSTELFISQTGKTC